MNRRRAGGDGFDMAVGGDGNDVVVFGRPTAAAAEGLGRDPHATVGAGEICFVVRFQRETRGVRVGSRSDGDRVAAIEHQHARHCAQSQQRGTDRREPAAHSADHACARIHDRNGVIGATVVSPQGARDRLVRGVERRRDDRHRRSDRERAAGRREGE